MKSSASTSESLSLKHSMCHCCFMRTLVQLDVYARIMVCNFGYIIIARMRSKKCYVLKRFYHFHNLSCDTTSLPAVTTSPATLRGMRMEYEYPQYTALLLYSIAVAIGHASGLELLSLKTCYSPLELTLEEGRVSIYPIEW